MWDFFRTDKQSRTYPSRSRIKAFSMDTLKYGNLVPRVSTLQNGGWGLVFWKLFMQKCASSNGKERTVFYKYNTTNYCLQVHRHPKRIVWRDWSFNSLLSVEIADQVPMIFPFWSFICSQLCAGMLQPNLQNFPVHQSCWDLLWIHKD